MSSETRNRGDVNIREAVTTDLPDLVEMLHQLDAHVSGVSRDVLQMTAAGEEALHKRLHNLVETRHALVVVAEDNSGNIVAMATIGVWHGDANWENPERRNHVTAVIDDVWVDPAFRRRGISQRMLEPMLDFAEAQDAADLVLEYSLANPEADATWRRLGFEPTGVRAAATPFAVRAALAEGSTGKRRKQ